MKINLTQTVIAVSGCVLIGLATYITKDASCLWALILLTWMLDSAKDNVKD